MTSCIVHVYLRAVLKICKSLTFPFYTLNQKDLLFKNKNKSMALHGSYKSQWTWLLKSDHNEIICISDTQQQQQYFHFTIIKTASSSLSRVDNLSIIFMQRFIMKHKAYICLDDSFLCRISIAINYKGQHVKNCLSWEETCFILRRNQIIKQKWQKTTYMKKLLLEPYFKTMLASHWTV